MALSALLSAAPPAWGQSASPETATPDQQKQAQQRYEQGVQYYKASRYAEAADAFQASYGIVASPNSRLMYGRALRESGKLEEAYEELALTQQQASELAVRLPKYATAGENAENEMEALLKRVAVLQVDVKGADSKDAELTVGDRNVPRERWRSIAVKPGTYDVEARAPGGLRALQPVEAALGQITRVELDLSARALPAEQGGAAPAPAAPSGGGSVEQDLGTDRGDHALRPWAFVAGGIGLVGLATFAVAGSMSQRTFSDLEEDCPNRVCPAQRQDDIDRGKTQQMVANIGLAVGAVGLTAGVALFIIDLGSDEATPRARAVRVAAGPSSLSVAGSF